MLPFSFYWEKSFILFIAVLPTKEEWLCLLRLSKTSLSKQFCSKMLLQIGFVEKKKQRVGGKESFCLLSILVWFLFMDI